jgi:hypothetical protein
MSHPVCENTGMNLNFEARIAGFGPGKPNLRGGETMPQRTSGKVNNSYLFELNRVNFWMPPNEKQNSGVTAFDI